MDGFPSENKQGYFYFENTEMFSSLLIVVMQEIMKDTWILLDTPTLLVAVWCFDICSYTNWEFFVFFLPSWSVKQIGKPRFRCPYAVKSLLFPILSESGILWDAEQCFKPRPWTRIKRLKALRDLTMNIWCHSSWFSNAWKDVNKHPSGFSCFLVREQTRRTPASEWYA